MRKIILVVCIVLLSSPAWGFNEKDLFGKWVDPETINDVIVFYQIFGPKGNGFYVSKTELLNFDTYEREPHEDYTPFTYKVKRNRLYILSLDGEPTEFPDDYTILLSVTEFVIMWEHPASGNTGILKKIME